MKPEHEQLLVEWTARIFIAVLLGMCVYSFVACSTQYVPVETVRTDSIFLSRLERDSLIIRDSVYVKEKGDTFFEYRNRIVYRNILLNDTVYISVTDSVQVPVPVEKKLSFWEKQTKRLGEVCTGIVFVYMLYLLMRWIIKKRQ